MVKREKREGLSQGDLDRANRLLNAWLSGSIQANTPVSKDDIAAVWEASLAAAIREGRFQASKKW